MLNIYYLINQWLPMALRIEFPKLQAVEGQDFCHICLTTVLLFK